MACPFPQQEPAGVPVTAGGPRAWQLLTATFLAETTPLGGRPCFHFPGDSELHWAAGGRKAVPSPAPPTLPCHSGPGVCMNLRLRGEGRTHGSDNNNDDAGTENDDSSRFLDKDCVRRCAELCTCRASLISLRGPIPEALLFPFRRRGN